MPESASVEREGVGNGRMEEGSACENPKGWRVSVPRSSLYQVMGSRGMMTPMSLTLGQTDTPTIFHTSPELPGVYRGGQCSHPLFLSPSPWFYCPPLLTRIWLSSNPRLDGCFSGKLNSGFKEAKLIEQRDEAKE